MKFIVSSSMLLKNLQILNSVIQSNNAIAILNNFLFEIQNDRLIMSASDIETRITTSTSIESESVGSIAVRADLLTETLKTFADQPLTFRVFEQENRLEIVSNQGNYSFSYFDGDNFPRALSIENPLKTIIKGSILSKAIHYTIIATGKDEMRQIMMGVFFNFSDQGTILAATDACRLVRYERKDYKSKDNFDFTIPKKPLSILRSILAEMDNDIQVLYNNKNVEFSFQETKITCRLLEGKFPNFNSALPTDNNKFLTINRLQLLNSVRRIALFSNKTDYQMILKVSGNQLDIFTEDVAFSNKAKERLTCQYKGDDIQIAISSKSFLEVLSNLYSDEVLITMNSDNTPCLIYPSDSLEEGESLVALIMPIILG